MTRTELHELVDIVMDARERGYDVGLIINDTYNFFHYTLPPTYHIVYDIFDNQYAESSDFTQAVKEYIHGLG